MVISGSGRAPIGLEFICFAVLINSYFARMSIQNGLWFILTIVYGHSSDELREPLWKRIVSFATSDGLPWCVMGDFNACLYSNENEGEFL